MMRNNGRRLSPPFAGDGGGEPSPFCCVWAADAQDEAAKAAEALAWAQSRGAARAADPDPGPQDCSCVECDGSCTPFEGYADPEDDADVQDGDDPDDFSDPDYGAAGPAGGPGDPSSPGSGGAGGSGLSGGGRDPRPADLIVPLATLLGLARRPGEIQGFGLLDPALARELAAAAAADPATAVCVTVTSPEGYAIGHGCARPARKQRPAGSAASAPSLVALAARLNLTIPSAALPTLSGLASPAGLSRPPDWAFTPRGSPGKPDEFGTWRLILPGGRELTVRLDPVPTFSCDHRHESHRYQPGDRLRHLVQIRDGTCTFPPCNRHARESDFEHALPYDQGGKTCACNAGARSRACHQVKQSPGWNVTQPKPGWHQWQTPSGRIYMQEPKRYPT